MSSSQQLLPHSCRYCQKMVIDFPERGRDESSGERACQARLELTCLRLDLDQHLQDFKTRDERIEQIDYVLTWTSVIRFTVEAIERFATQGCLLSAWLHKHYIKARALLDHPNQKCLLVARECDTTFLAFGVVFWKSGSLDFAHFVRGKHGTRFHDYSQAPRFELVSMSDEPTTQGCTTNAINVDPASEHAFLLSHGWLRSCQNVHSSCPSATNQGFLPKRLLQIGQSSHDTQSIYLRDCADIPHTERTCYAALSYCWGGSQIFTTTKATLEIRKKGFLLEELPSTLRDAVRVTEQLGIHYLWIDALCIIQDDADDKAPEISRMTSVYSQAQVTIAATRADSADRGFLNPRPRFGLEDSKFVFQLPYRYATGVVEPVTLIPELEHLSKPSYDEPLHSRAWTLQERILSPRVLEYGTLQTQWNCRYTREIKQLNDGWRSHFGLDHVPWDYPNGLLLDDTRGLYMRLKDEDVDESQDLKNLRHRSQWYDLLTTYTSRNLSFTSDRLLAVSGMAERFAVVFDSSYVAGLRRSDLSNGLFWHRADSHPVIARPKEYQGPSWSWAACNSRVINDYVPQAYQVEVLECASVLAHETAKFGAVLDARLRIKGRLRPVNRFRPNEKLISRRDWFRRRDDAGNQDLVPAYMYHDCEEDEFTDPETECIPAFLLILATTIEEYHNGLVVREHKDGTFSRLGLFKTMIRNPEMRTGRSEEEWEDWFQQQVRRLNQSEWTEVVLK